MLDLKNISILFRPSRETETEIKVARSFFYLHESRVLCRNSLVIGRYSVLPNYRELSQDLAWNESRLINTYSEHQYIANFDYYEDVKEYTAPTWFRLQDVPKDSGPWVIKGRTNSRKNQFYSHMYCEGWEDLCAKYIQASNDPWLGEQGIIIRKYLPFRKIQDGLTHPMFNEWRCFFHRTDLLAEGFYWPEIKKTAGLPRPPRKLLKTLAGIISERVPFFVIDIGQLEDGSWRVVEINDGQMSGLSHVDPEELYRNLHVSLKTSQNLKSSLLSGS